MCLALSARTQTKELTYAIKGIVADSITRKGLDFITVSLKTDKNVSIRSALTKGSGAFRFSGINPGNHLVTVIAVGYKSKNIDVELVADKDLGTLFISAQTTQLNTVVITADQPLVTQEVDRIGYNVQQILKIRQITCSICYERFLWLVLMRMIISR